ncbi:MAG: pentapeptide repeat-containing protein [Scytonema sp. PMC 1069.18]|nr:pentapeptide repeat-containing protein [Scytonema sp. PMC 1069.18]MEC4880532.1 pentapeptide repeat-containing protein [Scytonema sp. PMC 1070.18]
MANNEHWALLKQGVKTVWNKWRTKNPETVPDLSEVDLHSINLKGADFTRTDLSKSNLCHADLSQANLSSVNLIWADLTKANLSDANLKRANLREANLTKANLIGADLRKADLTEANLSGADLRRTNLSGVDFFKANLSGADLRGANLHNADLRRADLSGVDLTGANLQQARISQETIIEEKWRQIWESAAGGSQNYAGAVYGWDEVTEIDLINKVQASEIDVNVEGGKISSETHVENLNTESVDLHQSPQEHSSDNVNHNLTSEKPIEEFQPNLEVVNLVFQNGINWEAFFTAFQKLQLECGSDALTIQAIEHKNDGAFVLRVNVSGYANYQEIQKYLTQEYDLELKAIEEKYRVELLAEDDKIDIYHRKSANLTEIIKLLADITIYDFQYTQRPENSYNQRVTENKISNNIAINSKRNLVETRVQIQQLLYEIAQTNPTTHDVVTERIYQEIQHNPMLKARLQAVLNAGGLEAVKVIFNHPLYSIPTLTIKGWLEEP